MILLDALVVMAIIAGAAYVAVGTLAAYRALARRRDNENTKRLERLLSIADEAADNPDGTTNVTGWSREQFMEFLHKAPQH